MRTSRHRAPKKGINQQCLHRHQGHRPGQLYQAESGLANGSYAQDNLVGLANASDSGPDPLGAATSPSRYAYAANDPMQKVDPEGLWTIQIGIALSGEIGPFGFNVNTGIAIDNKGAVAAYGTNMIGGGVGAIASAGVSFGASNACHVGNLADVFGNMSGEGGEGPDVGYDGFFGASDDGYVSGSGATFGLGVGGKLNARYSNTTIVPLGQLW